jgi:hypothetical protein
LLKIFKTTVNLGAYFAKWIECKIKEAHLLNAPSNYPRVSVHTNSSIRSSIKDQLSTFGASNFTQELHILLHHITLRSK